MKKLLAASLLSIGMCGAAYAGDITVGGVTWDPDYNAGGVEQDFISRFDFTQWFSNTSDAIGTVGSFSSAITLGDVLAAQASAGPGAATGVYLSGVGEWKEINGEEAIISSLTGGAAGSFCPGCEVTYAFGGLGLNQDNTFDISGAWARVYVDTTPEFDVPPIPGDQSTADAALGDLLWLDLKFTDIAFTAFGSGIASGFVDATLEIVGGAASGNFLPSFLEYNGSAFNNSNGLATRYSTGGNGSLVGNTIPEPATIAILGLGLVGLGLSTRRKA